MKQTIRFNSFETNSSSEHSCIICSEEEAKKLDAGELLIDWSDNLHTREEVEKEFNELPGDDKNDYMNFEDYRSENYKTLDEWCGDYESDETTIPASDKPTVVICRYGYDG